MNDIEYFVAKPKLVKIGGKDVEVKPFSVKDFDIMSKLASENEETRAEALREALTKTIKLSFPNATDEQIDNVSMEYLTDFVNAMLEVNNLSVPEGERKKLLEAHKAQ